MSKLMIQRTSMVPPMPINAKVQPNVQVSIRSQTAVMEYWSAGVGGHYAITPSPLSRLRLIDDGERLLCFNGLAGRNFNLLESSTDRRDDGNLHLHRFHDHHDVVFFDVVADLFFDLKNFPHHGRFDRRC